MKIRCRYFIALLPVLALVSWGVTAHRTIGLIAENHLIPMAKAAVQDLLGYETLAAISNWADTVNKTTEYRYTSLRR